MSDGTLTPARPPTLISRPCPVCHSDNEGPVFAKATFDVEQWQHYSFSSRKLPEYVHFRLVICPRCHLLYANPIPTLETLAQNYRDAGFDSTVEGEYASRTYGALAKNLRSSLPNLVGALDIGTGTGAFLQELLEMGFSNVAGVEPSHAPIEHAQSKIRPLIKEGLFNPADFIPASLSLVTCFQTFEHLYEPLETCQEAFKLLKKDGAILFVFHNQKSLSARLLGLKSPIYDVEHLQLFSPDSAQYMLAQCGFQNIRCKMLINSYPFAYWVRLLPIPLALKRMIQKFLNFTHLGSVPLPLPAGNFVAIAFKP
jgi:SAM-dependent methyltransferase